MDRAYRHLLLRVLGLPADANLEAIKRAHRKLARELHPDRKGGDEAKFKKMQAAYEVLTGARDREDSTGDAYKTNSTAQDDDWLPGAAHDNWNALDHALYEAVWHCDLPTCLDLLAKGANPDAYQNK
jgi:DnaJ-class molecular chaperone